MNSAIDKAEKIYKENYGSDFLLASIEIKNDKLDYTQNKKRQLANEIAESVYKLKKGDDFVFPNYIESIRISKHSQVSFSFMEQNFQAPYLTKEKLIEEIQKKENKISSYKKSDIKITSLWLMLVIGSLNSVSYQFNENIDYQTSSKFDRVYLMCDFEAKIIRIK